jgi:hypothetical protein
MFHSLYSLLSLKINMDYHMLGLLIAYDLHSDLSGKNVGMNGLSITWSNTIVTVVTITCSLTTISTTCFVFQAEAISRCCWWRARGESDARQWRQLGTEPLDQ